MCRVDVIIHRKTHIHYPRLVGLSRKDKPQLLVEPLWFSFVSCLIFAFLAIVLHHRVPQTPRPSLYLHSETSGGLVYWEPNVESTYLPIEGKVFDTIEECVDFYTFYAEIGGFEADKIDKCNYKEFGDIISFDATFRTNKYDMVFVPFTVIDNHKKCVMVSLGLLLREDTEAYTWILTSFMTAHEKQPTMIVTDQDGAMKLAIEEVPTESKHRLCMWHIMQKIPAKEIIEAVWACQILECKMEEGCEIVKVRDKRASTYRTLNTEKEKEVVQQKEYVAEYKEIIEAVWACQILECKMEEGCEIVKVRDKRASTYRTLNTEKEKEVVQQKEKVHFEALEKAYNTTCIEKKQKPIWRKNKTIEKLTNEANYVVDECLFLLNKDEGILATFVEQLKTIKQEVQVQVPKPPSQKTCDVIEDIYAVKKP
nr:hypothetical protein [Tanacetum cinerariifolium]